MARKPRIHQKGAVYHVLLHGAPGKAIFSNAADRRFWETLLVEGIERYGHRVHAFCWLDDLVMMVVQVDEVPLSRIMQNLLFRYTREVNRKHGDSGSLFAGRYRAILVDADQYLPELVRYVHNEPVRQGKVREAGAYRWSSHAVYTGKRDAGWLTTDDVLRANGSGQRRQTPAAFDKFVAQGRGEGERHEFLHGNQEGRLLGDQRFRRAALKPSKKTELNLSLSDLVAHVCRAEEVTEASLRSERRTRAESRVRQIIAALALELEVGNLSAVARRFGRDLSTVSRNHLHFLENVAEDPALSNRLDTLRRELKQLGSSSAGGKRAGKKAAARKGTGKKVAARRGTGKKVAARQGTGKKVASRQGTGKKVAGKKAAGKKAAGKKTAARKSSGKKVAARSSAAARRKTAGTRAASRRQRA